MKKSLLIIPMVLLVVTFSMANAQKNNLTKEMIGWITIDNVDEVKKLIAAGADLNEKFDFGASKDITILHLAVISGYSGTADVLRLLIDAGADVNVKYEDGGNATLLHIVAHYGDIKGAKTELLIAKGLDVNAKIQGFMEKGKTPLHFAADKGNIKVAEVLIKNGAELDAKISDTPLCKQPLYTPLHLAAQNGHIAVAELLITKRAKVNAKTLRDETPLDLAISKKHEEMVDLLRKHGGVSGKK